MGMRVWLVTLALVSTIAASCVARSGRSQTESLAGVSGQTRNPDGTWNVVCSNGEIKQNVPESRLLDPNDVVCNDIGSVGIQCNKFNPYTGGSGSLIRAKLNIGQLDNGTLLYPDGKVFMTRKAGGMDDYSLFYPNGLPLLSRKLGAADDRTIYWPEKGRILRFANLGSFEDGTIYHGDGKKWVIRRKGAPDDKNIDGLPREIRGSDPVKGTALVKPTADLVYTVSIVNPSWRVNILIEAPADFTKDIGPTVTVEECF